MKKTLDGLKTKEVLLLSVSYMATPEPDATAEFWQGGDYGIKQIKINDQHLIAIPQEYILELLGKGLLDDVVRCSKKCLKMVSIEGFRQGSYEIVFDTRKNTIKVSCPSLNGHFTAYEAIVAN